MRKGLDSLDLIAILQKMLSVPDVSKRQSYSPVGVFFMSYPDFTVKFISYFWQMFISYPHWYREVILMGKEMATHSSTLAWRIPWTEESGGLQSMGSQGVRHNWATRHSTAQWFPSVFIQELLKVTTEFFCMKKWKLLSHVWLFVTSWTMQSMEFSRPEYWSG